MARTSFHDVIIIGLEPAGLMAAGSLCRHKHRVLLVGQGGLSGFYDHEGIQIPALPAWLPPHGQAPLLDEFLGTLGLEDPVHPLGIRTEPALQVVTPDQRVEFGSDRLAMERELKRTYPREAGQILQILDALGRLDRRFREALASRPYLPPRGLRERARIRRISLSLESPDLPDVARWPLLLKILHASTAFYGQLEPKASSTAVTSHHILGLLGGMRTVPDLSNTLLQALRKMGVDLEIQTVAEEILFSGKTATGIKPLGEPQSCNGTSVLVNLSIARALETLPLHRRHRRFRLAAESVRPSRSLFAVNLVLPQYALPLGMGPLVILVRRPDASLEEDNLIRVHCQPFPGRTGRVLVNLSCIVPYRERALGREYLGPLQQRVLQAAAWLIPFLEENSEGRSSPFWESRGPDEGQPSPWELHPIIEADHPALLGAAVLPCRTPYPNVFFCGPEATPGLGLEGAAYSALQAARLVSERVGLKKIL